MADTFPLLLKEQCRGFPFVLAHTVPLLPRQPSSQETVLVSSLFCYIQFSSVNKVGFPCILLHRVALFQAQFSLLSIQAVSQSPFLFFELGSLAKFLSLWDRLYHRVPQSLSLSTLLTKISPGHFQVSTRNVCI